MLKGWASPGPTPQWTALGEVSCCFLKSSMAHMILRSEVLKTPKKALYLTISLSDLTPFTPTHCWNTWEQKGSTKGPGWKPNQFLPMGKIPLLPWVHLFSILLHCGLPGDQVLRPLLLNPPSALAFQSSFPIPTKNTLLGSSFPHIQPHNSSQST